MRKAPARPSVRGTLALAFFAALWSCEGPGVTGPSAPDSIRGDEVAGSGADPSLACTAPEAVRLIGGRTLELGTVAVANDEATLFVTFRTNGDWTLAGTALFVGASADGVPTNPSGNPVVGRFPHRATHAPGTGTYTFAVPLADGGGSVVIAAFAEVVNGDAEEGAWADGEAITPGRSSATYFTYAPLPCPGATIGPAGGVLEVDGLTLLVPPGALSEEVVITARAVGPPDASETEGFLLADGTVFDLGPDGLTFALPFEIAIGFDPSNLPPGVAASDLRVLHLNAGVTPLPSTVEEADALVRAFGDHFSEFALGAPEPGGTEDPFIPVACPDLALATASAMPLAAVAIGRLPDDWGEVLSARVAEPGGGVGVAFVERLDDGSAALVVPVHPAGLPDGGPVELRFNDDTFACAPVPFDIAALPPAPGEFGAVVDVLQEILDVQAGALGTTRAEIVGTSVAELPLAAWPLAIAQSVLDHPENPNSLRALAEGTAPFGNGADVTLADRLFARTGIREGLAGQLAASSAGLRATSDSGALQAAASALECGAGSIGLGSAALLDECMRMAGSAQFRLDGASGQVLGDLGFAAGLAGLVPHPAVKLGAAGAGLAIWGLQSYREAAANLLPSDFVGLQFQASPTVFLEDEPGPGEWSDAHVIATSKGWALDKLVLDAVFQAVGAKGAYDGWLDRFVDPSLANDLVGLVETTVVQEAINTTAGSDIVQLPAELFGPVDISDPAYGEAFVDGAAIELTSDREYEPRMAGQAVLNVRVVNAGGQFGGKAIEGQAPATVEVLELSVRISPEEVGVEPGDVIEFEVAVENAFSPEMVEVQALHGTADIFHLGGNLHRVVYTAPGGAEQFPDLVTVLHTATTGARGTVGAPARTASATIRLGTVTISPREGCLESGEMLQFDAETEGLADPALAWTASIGDIDEATGFYTADETGTAVIRAASVANPGIFDEVAIQVGGCTCSWSGTTGAFGFAGIEGDHAEFLRTSGGSAIENLTLAREDASASLVGSFVTLGGPPLPIGATGSFPIVVQGELGAEHTALGYTSLVEEGTSVEAHITENDGEVLAGSLTGTVFLFEPFPDGETVPFFASFRITRDPLESDETIARCTIGGVQGG